MIFGNQKETNGDVELTICNTKRVFETKFLGVVIDHKLSWKQHIDYIKGKISKSVAFLYKSRLLCRTVRINL